MNFTYKISTDNEVRGIEADKYNKVR